MSFAGLLFQDVTVLTAGTATNRYGDAEKSWGSATSQTVKGWVARRGGSEDRDGGREAEIADWVLYLHPEVTVDGRARVVWGGLTFEVDGPPVPAYTPRGLHHFELDLRRVDG